MYHPRARNRRDAARLLRGAGRRCNRPTPFPGARRRARRAPSISPGASRRRPIPARVQLGEIMLGLREAAPDAIFANGAGNFAIWARPLPALPPLQPAARADLRLDGLRRAGGGRRQALYPERIVVAFAGDGDFLMNGQEFATAVQYDLPIVVIVVDNGMYGTIRMHQEREYPGRVGARSCATPISPPTPAPSAAMAKQSRRRPVRARLRARAALGQAGDPARQDRPGGDHADDDAERDPAGRARPPRRRLSGLTMAAILADDRPGRRCGAALAASSRASPASPSRWSRWACGPGRCRRSRRAAGGVRRAARPGRRASLRCAAASISGASRRW